MKDLKEISKYTLSDLEEGLLSGMEDVLDAGDKYMDETALQSWFMNDKCRITKKKNGYVLRGNFKTKDIDDVYGGPKIVAVYGNFAVSDTKLTSLEGMFVEDAIVEGTFTIENNDNLTSLKGCPISVGTLVIANNKRLVDIDIAPNVLVNAYISKNGKKFKETALRSKMNVYKKIFCSVDIEEEMVNESAVINEAFKAPQLKRVADAIKKATSKDTPKENRFTFAKIKSIMWDKIEASQISEFDMSDAKSMTAARGFVYKKADGMFVLIDKDDDAYAIIYDKYVLLLKRSYPYSKTIDKYSMSTKVSNQDILDYVEKSSSFLFVDLTGAKWAYDLQQQRYDARHGALALKKGYERTGKQGQYSWQTSDIINAKQIRYYQDIADENRRRYETLVTQMKAQKALLSGSFNKLKARLDKAFVRYTALLSKIYANPSNYNSYDVEFLHNRFHDARKKDKWSISESGLFFVLEQYFRFIINASEGNRWMSNVDVSQKIKQYEDAISTNLDNVEAKLTELEHK